jgi:leader peptidase (prepilin peptidase) / N-methyltransferase
MSFWAWLFGLIIGSFLNVCIYRLPRGQSVAVPQRSFCPDCGRFLRWYDNVPIVSFLFLKGRCRNCQKRISFRYPLVEFITALLSVLIYVKFGGGLPYVFYFLLFAAPLVAITFIDLEHRIIPDIFSLGGIVSGFLAILLLSGQPWVSSLLFSLKGVLAGGGTLLGVSLIYEKLRHQEGIGGGDVKLAAMFGAFFGWKGVFVVLLFSSLFGSVVGLIVVAVLRKDLKLAIPFGPFLAAAALLYLFFGHQIVRWYLSHILHLS